MCGFAGYFGPPRRGLADAARAIRHRGPDMSGVSTGPEWGVAFNRLSIIDLSPEGMQPFVYDGVSVFANGEIYNYLELREQHRDEFQPRSGSDVEIVAFLYRKYGMAFLDMLNGMFAMVILDDRNGKKFLVRDRYGKKPLFYKHDREGVLFASEIKAMRQIARLEPDRTNIALNLSCWFLVQPLSLYQGVMNVNPGCYLEVQAGRVSERRWYAPKISIVPRSLDELKEGILERYTDAIRLRLRSDVPVGIYLSGGLDSVSMAHLARQLSPGNFYAFTARIKDKESWELNNTDTEVVARYCAESNMPMQAVDVGFEYWDRNIVRVVGNYEEIFTDLGVLVFYALAEAASKSGVKVLFSGVGGDELFGGYPWQAHLRDIPPPGLLARELSREHSRVDDAIYNFLCAIRNPITNNRLASLFRVLRQPRVWHAQSLCAAFTPFMRDMNGSVAERIGSESRAYFEAARQTAGGDLMNGVNYANVFTVLANQNYEVDLASMMHSVENRSPLLDYRLVEYMLSVADSVKVAEGPKGLMRCLTRDMLPSYVTSAKKSGPTMPLHLWLENASFRELTLAFLMRNRGVVRDVVSEDLASHIGKPTLHDGRAGALITFALVSLVIWAKQHAGSLAADSDVSFSTLAAAS
jgi:asparagine synthase (glutamine-hydrolysing)